MIGESPTRPGIFQASPAVVVTDEMSPLALTALQLQRAVRRHGEGLALGNVEVVVVGIQVGPPPQPRLPGRLGEQVLDLEAELHGEVLRALADQEDVVGVLQDALRDLARRLDAFERAHRAGPLGGAVHARCVELHHALGVRQPAVAHRVWSFGSSSGILTTSMTASRVSVPWSHEIHRVRHAAEAVRRAPRRTGATAAGASPPERRSRRRSSRPCAPAARPPRRSRRSPCGKACRSRLLLGRIAGGRRYRSRDVDGHGAESGPARERVPRVREQHFVARRARAAPRRPGTAPTRGRCARASRRRRPRAPPARPRR